MAGIELVRISPLLEQLQGFRLPPGPDRFGELAGMRTREQHRADPD